METKTTSINQVRDHGLTTKIKQLKLLTTLTPVLKGHF